MVAVLPVPQVELQALAESNVRLLKEAQDLVRLIEQVADSNLRNQMLEKISTVLSVGQVIDRTVRAAVYTASTASHAA